MWRLRVDHGQLWALSLCRGFTLQETITYDWMAPQKKQRRIRGIRKIISNWSGRGDKLGY